MELCVKALGFPIWVEPEAEFISSLRVCSRKVIIIDNTWDQVFKFELERILHSPCHEIDHGIIESLMTYTLGINSTGDYAFKCLIYIWVVFKARFVRSVSLQMEYFCTYVKERSELRDEATGQMRSYFLAMLEEQVPYIAIRYANPQAMYLIITNILAGNISWNTH